MEKIVIINSQITDYSVNEKGDIFSNKFGKKLKLKPNTIRGGYYIITPFVKKIRYNLLVHRIVAIAFVENPDSKPQINHRNGIKTDNRMKNLEWVTQSENIKHAYENKLMIKTYKNCYNAKLTEQSVLDIRQRLINKEKQRDIASLHGVNEQVISSIKYGRSYKEVPIF